MFWKIGYFARDFWEAKGPFEKVLEVGSRNVNGSIKDFISGYKEYTGIDMIDGKDVDIVMNAHDLLKRWDRPTFDVIFCCETLEHDNKFWITVENMRTILKPGGWLLVTTPSINFFRHDFPSDYYRFTDSAYKDFIFEGYENINIEIYEDKNDPVYLKPNNTILGYAQKPL